MSQGEKRDLAEVRPLALQLVALLEPACERIEIAGSIRRLVPTVGDIEIVAIPRVEQRVIEAGFWGSPDPVAINLLEERIHAAMVDGLLALRAVAVHRRDGQVETSHRDGPSYKALDYAGMAVDLFVTDRERWGCIFALRTGPHDWNIRLVQDCQRIFRRVDDGRVLHLGTVVPTPEERDFFRELGQPWVEPEARHVDRVRIDGAIANARAGA